MTSLNNTRLPALLKYYQDQQETIKANDPLKTLTTERINSQSEDDIVSVQNVI
jgi:hypothetical protein